MQFALDPNNKRIQPTPKAKGKYPGCGNEGFSKCGDINIWHLSHRKGKSCDDSFFEPETSVHINSL
jgi:competence CoiA-like predicted nuclease